MRSMIDRARGAFDALAVALLLALAAATRWWFHASGRGSFDSDDAGGALQAKDIWLGRDIHIFFAGQDYGGSLDIALMAPFFALRGRADTDGAAMAAVALTILSYLLFHLFARWAAGRVVALMTLAILVFNSSFFMWVGLKQYGGYLMLPISATAILWAGMALDEEVGFFRRVAERRSWRLKAVALATLLGLSTGVGWWSHRAVVFSIGALALGLAWRFIVAWRSGADRGKLWRTISLAALGALLVHAVDHPWPFVGEGAMAPWLRIAPVFAGAGLLVVLGERWAAPRFRGAWVAGVASGLIGYGPVLWFVSQGNSPMTNFQLVSLSGLPWNLWVMLTNMAPQMLGIRETVASGLVGLIAITALAVASAAVGVVASVWSARHCPDGRLRRYVVLIFLGALLTIALQSVHRLTGVGGNPRHMTYLIYALAALCGVGWVALGRWRAIAPVAALALFACHGLASSFATPSMDLDEDRIPLEDRPLLDFLIAEGVRGAYMMDYQPGRGYGEGTRLTFQSDERVIFVIPRLWNRFPKHAKFVAKQSPAVWVARKPAAFEARHFGGLLPKPLRVVDADKYVVGFFDDPDAVRRAAYELEREPDYDAPRGWFAKPPPPESGVDTTPSAPSP